MCSDAHSALPASTCGSAPFNGDILNPAILPDENLNQLEIRSDSKANAIVKLRDEESGQTLVSFFIARGNVAALKHIPDGSFWLQFAFGGALDSSCARFARTRKVGEFPKLQTFESNFDGRQILHTRLSFTLRRAEWADNAANN